MMRSSVVVAAASARLFSLLFHSTKPSSIVIVSQNVRFVPIHYRTYIGIGNGRKTHHDGGGVSKRRRFTTRASTQVNDSGSIDSPLMQSMENKIKEHLNAELVSVKDAYGDGRHVSIDVISSAFEGQSAVNRQRMVYKAIWEELQNTVHAVDQMTTKTPSEAAAKK